MAFFAAPDPDNAGAGSLKCSQGNGMALFPFIFDSRVKNMLEKADNGKYAIPHFNINNLEWTRFILEECENLKTPVIIGVSEGAGRYMGGFKTVADMVKDLIN